VDEVLKALTGLDDRSQLLYLKHGFAKQGFLTSYMEGSMNVRTRTRVIGILGAALLLTYPVVILSVEAVDDHAPARTAALSFFDRLCDGEWYGGYESAPFPAWPKHLTCPGLAGDNNGFVQKLTQNDTLENGRNGSRTIETYPTMQDNGFIRGTFSLAQLGLTLQDGDHFTAEVGFVQGMTSARARFMVIYDTDPIESGGEHQLADFTKNYTGTLRSIDINLSQFSGQSGDLILRVETAGPYTQDRAVWVNARIERPQPPAASPTSTSTLPPTATSTLPPPQATTPPPAKITPTVTPTKDTIPGCDGVVFLSQDPIEPDASQRVTFLASAHELCDLAHVDLWVNNEKVHECSKLPCEYVGGPFPEGVHIFDVVAEGLNGDFLPSENVIVNGMSVDTALDYAELDMDPCPVCPDQPDLGPCVQQICYGPSQPNYNLQEENFISCLYQGVDYSKPWMLLAGQTTNGWYTDTCLQTNVLAEYYCQGTGGLRELHYTCPYECVDGACAPCYDSDGGASPFVYGITSWGIEDTCINDDVLREYFVQPEACMQCYSTSLYQHGKFPYTDLIVNDTALDALMEYANCLRSDALLPSDINNDGVIEIGEVVGPCSAELPLKVFSLDYSTITAADLFNDLDAVMEAVAWYVDEHMGYLDDDSRGSNVPKVQDAAYTLRHSGDRGCVSGGAFWQPNTPAAYCGDCEDYAILRETLMRYLGVSKDCAFCADKINQDNGEGGGHTFNIVRYRNKFRIMDYGPVGVWFVDPKAMRVPFSLWNDYYGEYWCYLDKSRLGDGYLDAGCWRIQPWDRTWNYHSGNRCPTTWSGHETYQSDICP